MAFVGADDITNMLDCKVFVSYRGPDISKQFIKSLFNDLMDSGFKVFKYNEKLMLENEILTSLYQGIQQSQLYIVILSPTFAESRWCLDEIVKIMECMAMYGRTMLPVFYNVEPSNVRRTDFKSLKEVGKKIGMESSRVKIWKEALVKISRRVGLLSFSDTNWNEELLRERIIEMTKRIAVQSYAMVDTSDEHFHQVLPKRRGEPWMAKRERSGDELMMDLEELGLAKDYNI